MLLEWTMQINCRPARLGIVNLSKMNKVKGKKERKKEEVDSFKKVYFVLLSNGQKTPPLFSIYEHSSPFLFLGYYMVSVVGRFSLSSSNVFSLGQPAELLFITPQTNNKSFQGRTSDLNSISSSQI
jgi:hypothetical protein